MEILTCIKIWESGACFPIKKFLNLDALLTLLGKKSIFFIGGRQFLNKFLHAVM